MNHPVSTNYQGPPCITKMQGLHHWENPEGLDVLSLEPGTKTKFCIIQHSGPRGLNGMYSGPLLSVWHCL